MSGPDTPTQELVSEHKDDSLPDLRLANIVVKEALGVGGFGSVYIGYHELMQRPVAIKVLKRSSESQNWQLRFQREAQALSKLSHQNIVQIYSFQVTDAAQAVLVMEHLDGKNLQQLVDEQGVLSTEKAVAISNAICDAMQYAHEQGVLHRDLKPSNVFICSNGQVKVLDFGVAKILEPSLSDQKLTSTGQFVGTPAYMSPEECAGKPASIASDIYAIGCILYFMLTGEALFSANTDVELMLKHCKETPRLKRLALSDDLIGVLGMALKKEPSSRYRDCKAFKDALASEGIFASGKKNFLGKSSAIKVSFAAGAIILLAGFVSVYLNQEKKTSNGSSISHATIDLWINEARAVIQKDPAKAMLLLQKAEGSSAITEQQRWTTYTLLETIQPSAEQKLLYARKLLKMAEDAQKIASRTERNSRLILAHIAVARDSASPADFEANLAKAFALLKKTDKSSALYRLWADYYVAQTSYYQERGDYGRVLYTTKASFDRLNEPIFYLSSELATMYSQAINAATYVGDKEFESKFRERLKKSYFFCAADNNWSLAKVIMSMLANGFYGLGENEKLSFLRQTRRELLERCSREDLIPLERQILQLMLDSTGRARLDLLSKEESAEVRKCFNISNVSKMDEEEKRQLLSINSILIANDYNNNAASKAIKQLSQIMQSNKLSDASKLLFIANVFQETTEQTKFISPEFESVIENSYWMSLKKCIETKQNLPAADWDDVSLSFRRLEGASTIHNLFFGMEFADKIHKLCLNSNNIDPVSKIITLNWVCLAHAEAKQFDLLSVDQYRRELLEQLAQINDLAGGFDTTVIFRCRACIGLLYVIQNKIADSIAFTEAVRTLFEQRSYFKNPSIEADVISDWLGERYQKLTRYHIAVDTSVVDDCLQKLRLLSTPVLLNGDGKLLFGIQDAIAIYAFNGESKKAYAAANEFISLSKKYDCLPKTKIEMLCLIPRAVVHGRIERPTQEMISSWKTQFLSELSRSAHAPVRMLGYPGRIIQDADAIALLLNSHVDETESIKFTREVMSKLLSFPGYLDSLHEWKLLDIIHEKSKEYRKRNHADLMQAQELKRYNELAVSLRNQGILYLAHWHNLRL